MDLAESLLYQEAFAVPEFIKSLPTVLEKLTMIQVTRWYEEGVRILGDNKDGGIAFFKIESTTSESMLETLSSSLELERVKGVVKLYCSALSGSTIDVLDTQELVNKNIGWVDEDTASTDGTKVFLPPIVDHYPRKDENFAWFKVVATHQVGHLEFGSFNFVFEKSAACFDEQRRAELELSQNERQAALLREMGDDAPDISDQAQAYTDIGRFLNLFEDRKLAFDLFTVLEDCRLDYRIKME